MCLTGRSAGTTIDVEDGRARSRGGAAALRRRGHHGTPVGRRVRLCSRLPVCRRPHRRARRPRRRPRPGRRRHLDGRPLRQRRQRPRVHLAAVHPAGAAAHPGLAEGQRRRPARQGVEDRLVPLPHQRSAGHHGQALDRGARLRQGRDLPVVPGGGAPALPVGPPDRGRLGPRLRLAVLLARLQRRRRDHDAGASRRALRRRRARRHPRLRRLQHGRRRGRLGRRLRRRSRGSRFSAGRLPGRLRGDHRPGRLSLRQHVRAARGGPGEGPGAGDGRHAARLGHVLRLPALLSTGSASPRWISRR